MLSFTIWGGSAACAERLCMAMASPTAVENAVAATIRFMVGSSLLFRLETRRTFNNSLQVRNWLRDALVKAAQDWGERPTRRRVFIELEDSPKLALHRIGAATNGGPNPVASGHRPPPPTPLPKHL